MSERPKHLEGYPLTWPESRPRTSVRRGSPFEVGFTAARADLLQSLKRLGARDVVISTNIRTRRDGLPLADEREPSDPGVAVYFDRLVSGRAVPFVIACDRFNRVRANLRAIGLTVEALRSIERYGAGEMLEQAFTGFAALPPAPAHAADQPWFIVLGVPMRATAEEVREAYRRLAREHHPDRGGDESRMARINQAYEAWQRTEGGGA